jgi:hypothetical protein
VPLVQIYSDESYGGKGLFVVAGVSIDAFHTEIWRALIAAESESGKGKRDWHNTRDPRTRRAYLERALSVSHLIGRVFYRLWAIKPAGRWDATVVTLNAAVTHFAENENCSLAHEGFTEDSRKKLRHAVRTSPARSRVNVATGSFDHNPMIRLADSLSGAIRLLRSDPARASRFEDLDYDWFVDLEP